MAEVAILGTYSAEISRLCDNARHVRLLTINAPKSGYDLI